MKLEESPKEFMADSKLSFVEQSIPPFTEDGKTSTVYYVLLNKNPYFKSKINKLSINIDPKGWGKYFITQRIEFDNAENVKKEAQKLDKVILPMAEKHAQRT
jgi:hypothetical protein